MLRLILLLLFPLACSPPPAAPPTVAAENWSYYLGDAGTTQYSALTQIDTQNVSQLVPAWTYASGDLDTLNRGQIQCNPLIVNGVLYGTNPQLKAFALNAATGEQLWQFDPASATDQAQGLGPNRGLSYWTDGQQATLPRRCTQSTESSTW